MIGGCACADWPYPWRSSWSLPPGPALQLPRGRVREHRNARAERAGTRRGHLHRAGDGAVARQWRRRVRGGPLVPRAARGPGGALAGIVRIHRRTADRRSDHGHAGQVTSGEAISLVRDQPVLMVATWAPDNGAFVTRRAASPACRWTAPRVAMPLAKPSPSSVQASLPPSFPPRTRSIPAGARPRQLRAARATGDSLLSPSRSWQGSSWPGVGSRADRMEPRVTRPSWEWSCAMQARGGLDRPCGLNRACARVGLDR